MLGYEKREKMDKFYKVVQNQPQVENYRCEHKMHADKDGSEHNMVLSNYICSPLLVPTRKVVSDTLL